MVVLETPCFDQVQLECAQILGRSQIGGTAKEAGEPQNGPQVAGLCLWAELAQRHIVDHALAQWADGLVRMSHGSVSCDEWSCLCGNYNLSTGQTLTVNLLTTLNPGTLTAVAV